MRVMVCMVLRFEPGREMSGMCDETRGYYGRRLDGQVLIGSCNSRVVLVYLLSYGRGVRWHLIYWFETYDEGICDAFVCSSVSDFLSLSYKSYRQS